MKKGKILHQSPVACWSYACTSQGRRLDEENGDVGWEGRRKSGRKRIQRGVFTDSPEYDRGDNFHKNRDNSGRKRKNWAIVYPLAPIFKKNEEKNKNESDGKKMKNG